MLYDIPEDGIRKLNITVKELFEGDLRRLLGTLEKLCQGRAEHTDYVKEYKYFLETWSPEVIVSDRFRYCMRKGLDTHEAVSEIYKLFGKNEVLWEKRF